MHGTLDPLVEEWLQAGGPVEFSRAGDGGKPGEVWARTVGPDTGPSRLAELLRRARAARAAGE